MNEILRHFKKEDETKVLFSMYITKSSQTNLKLICNHLDTKKPLFIDHLVKLDFKVTRSIFTSYKKSARSVKKTVPIRIKESTREKLYLIASKLDCTTGDLLDSLIQRAIKEVPQKRTRTRKKL